MSIFWTMKHTINCCGLHSKLFAAQQSAVSKLMRSSA